MSIKVGDVYGIYEVLEVYNKKRSNGRKLYKIKCTKCGEERITAANCFAYNSTISVSCNHVKRHYLERITNKKLRSKFNGMLNRCYNINSKDYHNYGANGIYICDEWLKYPENFEQWAYETGYDNALTIDRIDSAGPYAPWNCRWLTFNNNAKFRSITNIIEVNGITDSGRGWAKRLDLPKNKINTFIKDYGIDYTIHYIENTRNGFQTLIPKKNMKGILF